MRPSTRPTTKRSSSKLKSDRTGEPLIESGNSSTPVCIVDTCIGGLSVVKSLWGAKSGADVFFIADYAINPLGVKSDFEIGEVIHRWTGFAQAHSDTLLLACNTLSIRYHQLFATDSRHPGRGHIVSMVDCFTAMTRNEMERLAGRNVLIVGTEFTASQVLYPDLLRASVQDVRVSTVAATELERKIARFEARSIDDESVLTEELRRALENTDIAVLACTCFPMVKAELETRFPGVEFLDPGAYAARLLAGSAASKDRDLRIRVTGDDVSADRVKEFAVQYLDGASVNLY